MTAPAEACWLCGSHNTKLWKNGERNSQLVPEDMHITDSRYGLTLPLHRCRECSFVFAETVDAMKIQSLYERLSDPEYEAGSDNRARQMRWVLDLGMQSNPTATSLLDIGAGIGLLVAEARRAGLRAIGVEPSRALSSTSSDLVLQGTYPHPALGAQRFDLIYLVDVIEHVPDPIALLTSCHDALSTGGRLIVVTPDIGSVAASLLGKRWWHFRLAHIGYFNQRSMAVAAAQARLTIHNSSSAQWFFPISYLADRIAVYLPFIQWINRAATRRRRLQSLYARVVTVNLRDSRLFVMGVEGATEQLTGDRGH